MYTVLTEGAIRFPEAGVRTYFLLSVDFLHLKQLEILPKLKKKIVRNPWCADKLLGFTVRKECSILQMTALSSAQKGDGRGGT